MPLAPQSEFGPSACPRCGADMRIIAFITETAPVRRMLSHIGASTEPPRIALARGPPAWDDLPVAAIPDRETLAQPSPEYVFDQEVQSQPPSVVGTRQRRAGDEPLPAPKPRQTAPHARSPPPRRRPHPRPSPSVPVGSRASFATHPPAMLLPPHSIRPCG